MQRLLVLAATAAVSAAASSSSCDSDSAPLAVLTLPDLPAGSLKGDALRDTNWRESGTKLYRSGALELAVQHFAASTLAEPMHEGVWINYGEALLDIAQMSLGRYGPELERRFPAEDNDALATLCEGVAAFDMSAVVAGLPAPTDPLRRVQEELAHFASEAAAAAAAADVDGENAADDTTAGDGKDDEDHRVTAAAAACEVLDDKCVQLACGAAPQHSRYGRARRAVELSRVGEHMDAVRLLCRPEPSELTVRPAQWEAARGALSARRAFELWALFRVCGVAALADALPVAAVERVGEATKALLEEKRAQLDGMIKGGGGAARRADGATLQMRDASGDQRRYELKLPHARAPFNETAVVANELLLFMAKLFVQDAGLAMDTYSTIVALPGCRRGHMHADVLNPFEYQAAVSRHQSHFLPPGLVAIVPLVDLDATNGPTSFQLGSHVRVRGDPLSDAQHEPSEAGSEPEAAAEAAVGAAEGATRTLEVALHATRGSAVLFDLRVRHRGGANRGPAPRSILYLGYTLRWWEDVVTFSPSHSAAWQRLPSRTQRALFARLDHVAYVARLERELEARGVDVAAMRADESTHAPSYIVRLTV